MNDNRDKKTLRALIWSFSERITAQLISTVVTIVLARLLMPEHYGMVSIVTVMITLLNVFVTGGFGTALVQKREADGVDFDTAFWLSFSVSILAYMLLYVIAPAVSSFYDMPLLKRIIRTMGMNLPLSAINSVQQAEIQRAMEFRKFFWATLIGTLISGVVGIALAFYGAGVWALVVQSLVNTSINTIAFFIIGSWKPRFQFSAEKARTIWSYGWKVLMTQLVYTLEGDVRSLIVGKVFGSSDLAYYDQGKKYPALLVNNISTTIDKVMLPAYSQQRDSQERLRSMLRRSVRIGIYMLAPLLFGLSMVAESFVSVFFTEKWLPCVPYIQIFCLSYLTRPLESSCHQILLAVGKSGTVLACMFLISGVGLLFTLYSVFILQSVFAIAAFSLASTLISVMVFFVCVNKNIGYPIREQMEDIVPSLLVALVMCGGVYAIGCLSMTPFSRMLLQIVVGAFIYILLSYLFKIEPFVYIITMLKKKRNNK